LAIPTKIAEKIRERKALSFPKVMRIRSNKILNTKIKIDMFEGFYVFTGIVGQK
jgi:hypothetical protein